MNTFTCFTCGKTITNDRPHITGYGIDKDNNKICYTCCANDDRQQMRDTGKITLYLTGTPSQGFKLTNWPGSFEIRPTSYHLGRHNIARTRTDVWFVFDGYWWHGVQYGEFTQLCHCKKTKQQY